MLEVDIDKILPVTEARDNFNKIVDEVEGTDHMYVLTKNGKPSAVVVGVNHLEKLTGKTADELTSIVEKKADETPVVEEVSKPTSNLAGGSKPPAAVPSENRGATDSFATGQSIQSGMSGQSSAPIDVPIETEGSVSPPEPAPAPTSSTQRVPSDPGPGSVPAPSRAEVAMPEVASNQAPAATPTDPPTENGGGAASSDSDLFV